MKNIFFLLALFSSLTFFSQETTTESLQDQFNTLYRRSTSYQEYKVMSKDSYRALQKNVADTVSLYKTEILDKNSVMEKQKAAVLKLTGENSSLTNQLNEALHNENSISLFGIQLTKSLYSFILFSLLFLVLILFIVYFYKFKNSNVLTMDAKYNLADVENEFNVFRKKSLEREQKLRRELQDEIIKNRDS